MIDMKLWITGLVFCAVAIGMGSSSWQSACTFFGMSLLLTRVVLFLFSLL